MLFRSFVENVEENFALFFRSAVFLRNRDLPAKGRTADLGKQVCATPES
jgi:hypothetical protein